MTVDPKKLEEFMGKMVGLMTGSTLCYSIWLGDELGLYRELAGTGPRKADSVAAKLGCNARWCGNGSMVRRRAGWWLTIRPPTPTSYAPRRRWRWRMMARPSSSPAR